MSRHYAFIFSLVMKPKNSKMIAKKFINPAWSAVLEGLSELNCSSDGGSAHGANVVLCSGGHRVKLHQVMVRRFTRIFHWLPLLPDQQCKKWFNHFLFLTFCTNSSEISTLATPGFHQIYWYGHGDKFCVCFDFSSPFFPLGCVITRGFIIITQRISSICA